MLDVARDQPQSPQGTKIKIQDCLLILSCLVLTSCSSKEIKPFQDSTTCSLESKESNSCLSSVKYDGKSFVKIESLLSCPHSKAEESKECSESGELSKNSSTFVPWPPDECGCDGKVCQPGYACHLEIFDLGAGCGFPPKINQCVSICSDHQDCADDELCFHSTLTSRQFNQCRKVSCKSDSDCTERPCGKCVVDRYYKSQCLSNEIRGTKCYYEGDAAKEGSGGQSSP